MCKKFFIFPRILLLHAPTPTTSKLTFNVCSTIFPYLKCLQRKRVGEKALKKIESKKCGGKRKQSWSAVCVCICIWNELIFTNYVEVFRGKISSKKIKNLRCNKLMTHKEKIRIFLQFIHRVCYFSLNVKKFNFFF